MKDYCVETVMCKACKYSKNMPFYENVYSCDKHSRLFMPGNFSCADGVLVSNPKAVTPDDYYPDSWKECDELTAKRNAKED